MSHSKIRGPHLACSVLNVMPWPVLASRNPVQWGFRNEYALCLHGVCLLGTRYYDSHCGKCNTLGWWKVPKTTTTPHPEGKGNFTRSPFVSLWISPRGAMRGGWQHLVANAQREEEGRGKCEAHTFGWVPKDWGCDPFCSICIQGLDEDRIIMKLAHDTELGKMTNALACLKFYPIRFALVMHSTLHFLMEHLFSIN